MKNIADGPTGGQRFRISKPFGVLLGQVRKLVEACCSLLTGEFGPSATSEGVLRRGNCTVNILLSGRRHIIHNERVVERVSQCQLGKLASTVNKLERSRKHILMMSRDVRKYLTSLAM